MFWFLGVKQPPHCSGWNFKKVLGLRPQPSPHFAAFALQDHKRAAGGGGGHTFQAHALGGQSGGGFRVQKHLFFACAHQYHFGQAAVFGGRLKKILRRKAGGFGFGGAADAPAGEHDGLRINLSVDFDSARRISRNRSLPFGACFFNQHRATPIR